MDVSTDLYYSLSESVTLVYDIYNSTLNYNVSTEESETFNSTFLPDFHDTCSNLTNSSDITKELPGCKNITRAKYSRLLSIGLVACVSIVMFAMGCKVETEKIIQRIVRPWGIFIGFLCQFGIMPLSAFAIGKLLKLSQAKALVVLIMGTLPGGNTSNIVTYWCNGDLDLSVAMTAMSTIMAFAMMPLCLLVYGSSLVDESVTIPYLNICFILLAFMVPIGAGILINYLKPSLAKILGKVGMIVGLIVIAGSATVGILLYPTAFTIPPVYWKFSFALPLLGYVLGYLLAFVIGKLFNLECIKEKQRRTIAIETGTQNAQLCTAIIQLNYGCSCMILEMYSYPLVYYLYQVIEALIFCIAIQIHRRCFKDPKTTPTSEINSQPGILEGMPMDVDTTDRNRNTSGKKINPEHD